jgi:hypothetical protein
MSSSLTPGVLIALLVVAALLVGSYLLARRQSEERQVSPLKRQRQAPSNKRGANQPNAQTVLQVIKELQASGANWNSISLRLNPTNDAELAAELHAIRGPHMFVPATALSVLEQGCREALKNSPSASVRAALVAARRSMEKVTRYGD